jgi:GTPase SAR1 family protein
MKSRSTSVNPLTERLCRPQRIGVFGHRGVGKTTLLAMLYREAVGGRLPGLRLAAGDPATARYLADKILQLEAGEVLPATLAETDLRFQLYHRGGRIELLARDYQGEHVELGRQEPVRDFLRNCDAVWLCFDPALLSDPAERLNGQQEAEQIIEDYLALEPQGTPHRPMALVLTKADLLTPAADRPEDEWLAEVAHRYFGMTLHALQEHSPGTALFAVSALGPRPVATSRPRVSERDGVGSDTTGADSTGALEPNGLDQPLVWLVEALQAQDEARLQELFRQGDVSALRSAVPCFERRYPHSPRAEEFRNRLRKLLWARRRRRGLVGVAVALFLTLGLWGWDALAYHQARRFDQHADDPVAARQHWQRYVSLPLSIGSKDFARRRLAELDQEISRREMEKGLAELNRRAEDGAADPKALQEKLQAFHARFPDAPGLADLRARIKARLRPVLTQEAQRAYDELLLAEQKLPRTGADSPARQREIARGRLEELVAEADRFLRDFHDPELSSKVRERRDAYLQRIDEHDFETARAYSRREPLNFQTRRERYQAYLDRHPGGAFVKDARTAVTDIEAAWDRQDFRAVRDHYTRSPAELRGLTSLCERYLLIHSHGKYRDSARELLRWAERVGGESEYQVTAVRGDFSGSLKRWFASAPDLSIRIEVNGVVHGPSGVVVNDFHPTWNHRFPRPIRWKMGDSIRIVVTDHDWWNKDVIDITSDGNDRLSMRMLSGRLDVGEHVLYFDSDFKMPQLPKIE